MERKGGRRPTDRTPVNASEVDESATPFAAIDEKEIEAENERLDRNWYQMDDGYDDANNPFVGISLRRSYFPLNCHAQISFII